MEGDSYCMDATCQSVCLDWEWDLLEDIASLGCRMAWISCYLMISVEGLEPM
jgi:hypothetical protein